MGSFDYGVYVYGGGEILWQVFNGIAILFQSKNPYFTSVGTISVGVGLIYVAWIAVPQGSVSIFFKFWFVPTILLITLFFGPKSSVHIIDEVDPDFKYSKVDNIPVGIAAVAALSSQIGKYLAETVEAVFKQPDATRFTRVGTMFGSRLAHEASRLTIKDPLMRENIKDYVRQCFTWPYVLSNIEPGKKAALESDDIFGFIKGNPHPLLGVYWRTSKGTTFQKCSECTKVVEEAIKIEVGSGLASLTSKLFGSADSEKATSRLKNYFGEAWQSIAKGSSGAAEIIQQELMLNAYREGLQDKRDEFGMGRTDPELIGLNAARGQAYQNQSFLVKAALSGAQIVTLHTILFALSLIFFTVAAPLTFLPKGLSLLGTWLKVMAWLSVWPVLMSVLNSIGCLYAAKAGASAMIGSGTGLNLLTQNGLADAAYDAYCWVSGLQYSVPFLSWALVSGGGYAFSHLASSLTQGGESFAGKAAGEMVDGNVSFDSQSLHTKSVANSQMAQQQLGAAFNYGSRFDDGKVASLIGPNGQVTNQEHLTSLGTNVSTNDAFTAAAGMNSQIALQSAQNFNRMKGEQVNAGTNELFSLTGSIAQQYGLTETFGDGKSASAQQSFAQSMDTVKKFAKDHNISEDKAFSLILGAGISAGGGKGSGGGSGLLGKIGGLLSVGADARGQFSADGRNNESISKHIQSGEAKQFADNLSHGLQYLEDNKGSISDNSQRQKMDQVQESFNKAQQYSDQESASLQQSRMWSQTASTMDQKSLSTNQNINDEVLEHVAGKRFGGDMRAAAAWQSQNPSGYLEAAGNYMQDRKQGLSSFAHENGSVSPDMVRGSYKQVSDKITGPTHENVHAFKQTQGFEASIENLESKTEDYKGKTRQQISGIKVRVDKGDIQKDIRSKDQEFETENETYLITKAGRKMWNG